jgi:PAS domain S-box-containing protein
MTNSLSHPSDHFNQGAAFRIFQESIDPIILTERSGIILLANESTADLLEYGLEELKGLSIVELFDTKPAWTDGFLLADSRQVFDAVMLTKESQKLLNVKVQASQYNLDGTNIVLWILHDHTRQVELEQLRQDLSAMLVHDLQGPLGNIISSLESVTNELTDDSSETLQFMLDIALRSSQHLKYLVDSLMDISHLSAGYPVSNRSPIDAGELVDYVFAAEEPNLEQRGVIADSTIEPGLPKILAEESMLRRILLNLLDNALKYSQRGQTVSVTVQKQRDSGLIRFSVIDQGRGVPEGYRELIFEKFQRVKTNSTSGGLGLGLAFCRLAVEAHGGRIWVEDAPSGGACFCFTMPTVNEPSDSSRNVQP